MYFIEPIFIDEKIRDFVQDGSLSFQQMYLELNSILLVCNFPEVDRDTFLLYLSSLKVITLNKYGKKRLSVGSLATMSGIEIEEAYVESKYGVKYYTLLFSKSARVAIYKDILHYYRFASAFKFKGNKLTHNEISKLSELVSDNTPIEKICFYFKRKPLVIYKSIAQNKLFFPDEYKA